MIPLIFLFYLATNLLIFIISIMKSLISIITLLMLNLIAFGQGVNFEHITLMKP